LGQPFGLGPRLQAEARDVRALFAALDRDGDGALDAAEQAAALLLSHGGLR
jgi:hypothetical protein